MEFFDKSKKKLKMSIDEASSLISVMLFESSIQGSELFRDIANDIKEDYDEKKYWEIAIEFQFFFIHRTDRLAFEVLGAQKRSLFINSLIEETCNFTLKNAINKPKSKNEELKNMLLEYFDRLNARNIKYANYKKIFPEGSDTPKDTLLWEFGKLISNVVCGSDNILIVDASIKFASRIFITLKIKDILTEIPWFIYITPISQILLTAFPVQQISRY